jgi:DNA repair protein RecO (recombination protein O)
MAAEKTTAIVLRVIPFSETSCIVNMFTRDFGKITAMAKGARRPKSPFEAALDVLAICRIVFLDKSSGAMGLLTEAKLERRFRAAATNLKRLYAGYYVIELLKILTDEGDSNPQLFDLAVEVINSIDSKEFEDEQLSRHLFQFELKMLELLGHLPMLTKCVSCGKEKTTLSRVSFGLNAGGILCQDCRRGKTNIVSLSREGLQFMLNTVGGQIGADKLNSDNWNAKQRYKSGLFDADDGGETAAAVAEEVTVYDEAKCLMESRHLVNKYITHLLGFPPKLNKYLKNI